MSEPIHHHVPESKNRSSQQPSLSPLKDVSYTEPALSRRVEEEPASSAARRRGDTLLFDSNGESPLRMLSLVAFTFAVGSALLAALLLDESVVTAHFVPWGERLIWAGGLCVTFTAFFFAVWIYEKRMASRLVLMNNGHDIRLTTPTLFGLEDHDFAVEDVIGTKYHDGDRSGEESTSPPWIYVKVRGRPSFVVSLDGIIPNRDQLLRVLNTNH